MRVRFIPQWESSTGYIETLAPPSIYDQYPEYEVGEIPMGVESFTYGADAYSTHENAPDWVKVWPGPFEIEILRGETK